MGAVELELSTVATLLVAALDVYAITTALTRRLGVESTPTTFVNGRLVSGAQPYEVFAAIIDEELERAAK